MKTIRFIREQNTVNEYTCNCFDDCTGDFLRKEDVLDLLAQLSAQIKAEEADVSTHGLVGVISARNLLDKIRQEVK